MADYQPKYNKEIGLVGKAQIPFIKDQIAKLKASMNTPGIDPKMKEAMQHRINSFNIQIQSINKGKPITPVEENFNESGFDTTKQNWINKIVKATKKNKKEVTKVVHDIVSGLEQSKPGNYGYIVGTLKKTLSDKYKVNLNEDGEGASISTANIGSPTMSTSDGGTAPAIYGDSSKAVKSPLGVFGRRKFYPPNKTDKKKKKNNYTIIEFLDHYYDEK